MSIHTVRFVEASSATNGNSGIVWEGYCRTTGEHLFCLKLYYPSGKLADEAYWPELSVLRGLADEFINDHYSLLNDPRTPQHQGQLWAPQLRIEA